MIDQFSLTVRNKYAAIGLLIADDIIDNCELAEMLSFFFLSFSYQYKLEKPSLITLFCWSQPRSQLFNHYILSNSLHHPEYLMLTSLKSYPRLTVPVTNHLSKYLHRENQPYRILSHFPSNLNPAILSNIYWTILFCIIRLSFGYIILIRSSIHPKRALMIKAFIISLKYTPVPKLGEEFDFFRETLLKRSLLLSNEFLMKFLK